MIGRIVLMLLLAVISSCAVYPAWLSDYLVALRNQSGSLSSETSQISSSDGSSSSFSSYSSEFSGLHYTVVDGVVTITEYTGGDSSVTIPDTIDGYPVVSITSNAFSDKPFLQSISISSNVINIMENSFVNCGGLSNIEFYYTTPLSSNHFIGTKYSNTTFVTGTNVVTNYQFEANYFISNVILANGIESIEDYAFQNCSGITNINIPNSVESIGSNVFYGCTGLSNFVIPSSVTIIGSDVFMMCTGLTNFVFPSSVHTIGGYIFYDCSNLISVWVSNTTPPNLGANVFFNCPALTYIYVPSGAVAAYQGAANWSSYSGIITAMP